MAINSGDPTRGSGPDKQTQAEDPNLDAPPNAFANESDSSATPDPSRGGCLKFGWGCLPVMASLMLIPVYWMY